MEKFYRALEEKFRGSEEEIKRKNSIYLELIKKDKILDLGCGRGEFLKLLKEKGFKELIGVDLNPQMTKEIKNIKIYNEDIIEFLKKLENKSFNVIVSFHLVEHIEFEKVLELIKEAFRVLSDDGILIIETPNPENIKVATQNFYIDPTHKNPIPIELLKFSFEYFGFFTRVLRRDSKIHNSIKDLIENVSPDYAIIGFKNPQMINEEFFNRGISLDLAEYALEERIKNLEERMKNLEIEKLITENYHLKENNKNLTYENGKLKDHIKYLDTQLDNLTNENNHLKQQLDNLTNENNHLKQQLDNLTNENNHLKTLYNDIVNSKSWLITKPLREVTNFLRKKKRKTILHITSPDNLHNNDSDLSPRAKEIYNKLKKAIKENNDSN